MQVVDYISWFFYSPTSLPGVIQLAALLYAVIAAAGPRHIRSTLLMRADLVLLLPWALLVSQLIYTLSRYWQQLPYGDSELFWLDEDVFSSLQAATSGFILGPALFAAAKRRTPSAYLRTSTLIAHGLAGIGLAIFSIQIVYRSIAIGSSVGVLSDQSGLVDPSAFMLVFAAALLGYAFWPVRYRQDSAV